MGLLIRQKKNDDDDYDDDDNNNNNNPSPTRLLPAVAPPPPFTGFEDYLRAQNKRNTRQILCYTQRYSGVLQTGDASALVSLQSGAVRRHAMEALTAYAKYSGLYEEWCQIRKRYSLHWTNGDESIRSLERFFNPDVSLDKMIARIREMIAKTPTWMGRIVKFGVLVGLRPAEVIESVRLLNIGSDNFRTYYNPERQCLEHFRFPEIFLRRTKKAYISFVTPEILEIVKLPVRIRTATTIIIPARIRASTTVPSRIRDATIPSYNAIRHACHKRGINMDMRFCRRIFASWLIQSGIDATIVDMLQGRVSQSVLTRHYLTPDSSLPTIVLGALNTLKKAIDQ